jgi:hypothetical protein
MEWQHEVWAEAFWVEQNKGADGLKFIAERVAALAEQGDEAGVARWRRIAEAYDQLQVGRAQ